MITSLYCKRDGSPVEVNQVHARTSNYQDQFDKDGPKIRLREEPPMLAGPPPGITVFQDDDRGLFRWPDDHPDSYFINSGRAHNPTLQGMTKSAGGGPPSAGGTPLIRIDRGRYSLCGTASNTGGPVERSPSRLLWMMA